MLKRIGFGVALVALAVTVPSTISVTAQGLAPYSGSPAAVPGTIGAETYDLGGEGVAYGDTTPGNSGGAVRADDVDIEQSADGGYDVGWTAAGEWLNYTVNVAAAGQYLVDIRVAAPSSGNSIHVGFNNSSNVWATVPVPATGAWQAWTSVTVPVTLGAGVQQLTILFDTGGINLGRISISSGSSGVRTPTPLPGSFGPEIFDDGGEGVSYYDTTRGNSGGAYRQTDVDIEQSADGGYDIGWTAPSEWLNYTVNVAAAGNYIVNLRTAAPASGNSIHVGFNTASNVWVTVPIPATGGWQSWTTVSVPVTLGAGVQQLTILFDTGGVNLGKINVAAANSTASSTVDVWLTTGDGATRLAQQPSLTFVPGDQGSMPAVDVNDSTRYQQIEGFGGSITDSSALVLSGASAAQRSAILTALFDPQNGIGLSYLRQPIGSSDFAMSPYTFDDIDPNGTDYGLASFSIDHDRAYILPMLRAALAVNPSIKVMGTPWSAPAWMKTTRTITDGGNLRPDAFQTYANYFVKFVQAYQAEGVPIDSLTVQNEPQTAPPYPSMVMSSSDQATFIGQYLGPALQSAGLSPRIFAWDHNWDPTYPTAVLSDATAASFISGVAFHCYLGQPSSMTTVHNSFPTKTTALTECGDSSRNTFGEKLMYDVGSLLIASMRNWASTAAKWNLVLDQNGGPKLYPGSCINCTGLVTVDQTAGTVTYNEDYYALGHASRFVKRGAYRIDSTDYGNGGIEDVAFVNPDGSIVVLAINTAYGPLTFQIRYGGKSVQYTLPSGAVATFRWTR